MYGIGPSWVRTNGSLSSIFTLTVLCVAGMQAQQLMASGTLVPDAMILRLILSELTSRGWLTTRSTTSAPHAESADPLEAAAAHYDYDDQPSASFILDGFPRTAAQASQLDALVPINFVVHLHTPTSIILDRIANRWIHAPSGRVYNTTFNPPKTAGKDDITGETLTRRVDDDIETWKTRLRKFEETSMPLLDHYDELGVLWRVDGDSSDEISPKLFKEFGKRFGAIS